MGGAPDVAEALRATGLQPTHAGKLVPLGGHAALLGEGMAPGVRARPEHRLYPPALLRHVLRPAQNHFNPSRPYPIRSDSGAPGNRQYLHGNSH